MYNYTYKERESRRRRCKNFLDNFRCVCSLYVTKSQEKPLSKQFLSLSKQRETLHFSQSTNVWALHSDNLHLRRVGFHLGRWHKLSKRTSFEGIAAALGIFLSFSITWTPEGLPRLLPVEQTSLHKVSAYSTRSQF